MWKLKTGLILYQTIANLWVLVVWKDHASSGLVKSKYITAYALAFCINQVRGKSWFQIITGPNMGGKSTFIRQVWFYDSLSTFNLSLACQLHEMISWYCSHPNPKILDHMVFICWCIGTAPIHSIAFLWTSDFYLFFVP